MIGYKLILGDGTSCHDPSVHYTLGAEVERETGLWLYPTRAEAADAELTKRGRGRLMCATSYQLTTCEYEAGDELLHTHGGTKICVDRLVVRCLSPIYSLRRRDDDPRNYRVTRHAGGQAPITVVDGPLAPILLGSSPFFSIAQEFWPRRYHRSTRHIYVGVEWLRAHQPTGQSATSRYV